MRVSRTVATAVFFAGLALSVASGLGLGQLERAPRPVVRAGKGDSCLDLARTLESAGMPADDARWLATLMVEEVDTNAFNTTFNVEYPVVVWWRGSEADAPTAHVVQLRLFSPCVDQFLGSLYSQPEVCAPGLARFFRLRTGRAAVGPIPADTDVLMSIGVPMLTGKLSAQGCELWQGMVAGAGTATLVCVPTVVDPESGAAVPAELLKVE